MALTFPPGFPVDFLSPVIAQQCKAERVVRRVIQDPSSRPEGVRRAVTGYITTVFRAFAHQTCKAARSGHWPVDQIEWAVRDEFLRRLAVHAFFEFKMGSSSLVDRFIEQAALEIRTTRAWDRYLSQLGVAASSRAPSHRTSSGAASRTLGRALPGRALVDGFKERVCRDTGRKPNDIDLVIAAGYQKKSRNLLRLFLQNPKGRERSSVQFRRVLDLESKEFEKLVGRKPERSE